MTLDEVLFLVKKQKKIIKDIAKLNLDLKDVTSEITKNCPCPEDHSKKKSSWSYGGYPYQGEDRTWDECSICGKSKNLKIRYTGFG